MNTVRTIQPSKPKLVVLLGPTAAGKTNLSLSLAEKLNGEIISGDSMQVYRGMDIGTAKASEEERSRVPHHLIDIRNPDEGYSVSEFQQMAKAHIADIQQRGKLPFIVGGTGLYIESVCYEFEFSEVDSDPAFRARMQELADLEGPEALHQQLERVDPERARGIHANDTRRVIRALEIQHVSGKTATEYLQGQKKVSPYDLCIIGLTMNRQKLYQRIEWRIDQMLEEGLLEEVRQLIAQGYDHPMVSMQALGYKEMMAYLKGGLSYEQAVELLKRDTRRFAKRQLSWFRRMKDVIWHDVTEGNFEEHLHEIHAIIAGKLRLHAEYT
ncbi:tRNA (adenosine(37)-N6)-dimethylallyltransferase MiaA [Marinicrinis sediminis]|uniref:tRNA dimethylallyltransferase n=1 Tax=Marinicrinis sediminis TaxID=1652465 RepID=A0ABW5RDH8_9BACL